MFKSLSVHDGISYATAVTTTMPNCPESRRAILAQLLRPANAAALPSTPAPRLVDARLATSPLFCSVNAHRIAHGTTESDGLETVVDSKLEREEREERTPEAQHERGRAPNAPLLGNKPTHAFVNGVQSSVIGAPHAPRALPSSRHARILAVDAPSRAASLIAAL